MKRYTIDIGDWRFGVEKSTVVIDGLQYLTRWILYCGGTLRLHKFHRGDDDRASHTHPWWFITFPLSAYVEDVFHRGKWAGRRTVKPFRFYYRESGFEHIVAGRYPRRDRRPFYTIVITGHRTNLWGFYPKPGKFISYLDYK
jgi:hypothetical protein